MALLGNPRPSFFYPRIIYGTPSVTIDFDEPAEMVDRPAWDQIRTESISPSGRRKILYERTEELRTIRWQVLDSNKLFELAEFFRTHGGQGKQFELYLDRFTGAFLEFEGVLTDQQGTAGTFTGTPSYEAASFGKGLRLDAGEFLDFPTAPAGQQPSLIAGEGISTLVVKPSFAGADGLDHVFLDLDPAGNGRLVLRKNSSNNLELNVEDATLATRAVFVAVSWAANAEQKIVAKWKDAATMELWLNGAKATGTSGAGTGILPSLPTNVRMGADSGGGTQANGLYDRLGFFTRAFDLNASIVQYLTDSFFPRWKNYYAKAEVVDFRIPPEKQFRGRDLFRASLTFRAGVA